ncbi:IscS subfamily cysteine desulfurase [Bacillus sp. REN3]|uniref:IscS subfamily cysteine desulfurase n=1 Tax=Bacillus sp. REN3 TaxID=2802440 RepID=UPI001AED24D3|nr:IscS subfamily cysteine desulfurase [Bacillus sp. REN3]
MKYFDYAATTPLDQEAAEVYIKTATKYYGNSHSLHDAGSIAANILESCREDFARMLGIEKAGVYFTSGGSEANFLGIMALLPAAKKAGKHIITSAAEHSSILNLMKKLEMEGWEITYLPMNRNGQIELVSVIDAVRIDTILITIQHGNPEIGTIQPIAEISSFCRSENILLHSDCVQTFGKVPLGQIARSVDALSISGHKFYGPKGTGVAYVNPMLAWSPFLPGTVHEKGFRPGTVNIPGIAAMTVAAQKSVQNMHEEARRMETMRNSLIETISDARVNFFGSEGSGQLPGIVGLSLKGIEGQYILLECNRKGFAISTGTACHTGMHEPSNTMMAMGIQGKEAKEFIRISFGKETSMEDARNLAITLSELRLPHPAV